MIEVIFAQMATSVPIHFFAYAPFLDHLHWGKARTLSLVLMAEGVWLLLTCVLTSLGLPMSVIDLTSMPLFGILFFFAVDVDPFKVLFLYIFSVDYLMALRGAASFIDLVLFGDTGAFFYTWQSGVIIILLYALTLPFMIWNFRKTARIAMETDAPGVWNRAWLLPMINTLIVFLFTYAPQSSYDVNSRFLLARISLSLCVFFSYYSVLYTIDLLQKEIAAEEHEHYLEQLTRLQAAQYRNLESRIEEARRARHDLRQHLNAIQGYLDTGNQDALASYMQLYGKTLPREALSAYSKNPAVDAVLGFYTEKASSSGIRMDISFAPMPETIIPEPEFCVLLGNLLENALDASMPEDPHDRAVPDVSMPEDPHDRAMPGACIPEDLHDSAGPGACMPEDPHNSATPGVTCISPKNPPSITVHAQMSGSNMLFLTVDNSSPAPPRMEDGRLLSGKHDGYGIGTESVRSIAEKYHGDARFEWKDGKFRASVMLSV